MPGNHQWPVVSGLIFQTPPDSIGHNNIFQAQAVEDGFPKHPAIGAYTIAMRISCG
jgi:hypothetical protein